MNRHGKRRHLAHWIGQQHLRFVVGRQNGPRKRNRRIGHLESGRRWHKINGRFDQDDQQAAAFRIDRRNQKVIEVKEVKFRPGTDEGDYNIKMRNLRRFIAEDGDKGKVTLRFRGREITHQDIGMRLLERIRDELADVSVVEHMPKLEGRQMIMVLAPKKK